MSISRWLCYTQALHKLTTSLSGRAVNLSRSLLYLGLILICLLWLFPFYWVLTAAIKETPELRQIPPTLWPQTFTLEHLTGVWRPRFARYFLNTLIYAGGTTLIVLVTSSLLAFVLVKHPSRFGNMVFATLIASLMVPMATYVLPLFLLLLSIQNLSGIPFINTYLGMIFPWIGFPFGIFLMRQAMFSVPDELLNAARIDGASTFRIYWQIVLPIIRTQIVTLAIFVFMFKYDDLFWPLIIVFDSEMYPIAAGLVEFIGTSYIEYGLLTAASVMVIAPILLLYLLLQRQIVKGIGMTGMGG